MDTVDKSRSLSAPDPPQPVDKASGKKKTGPEKIFLDYLSLGIDIGPPLIYNVK